MAKVIGLTGHTAGIGLAIRQTLEANGHQVLGFSRSNGYDLSKQSTLERIIAAVEGCDVFINNANYGWQQIEILYRLAENWKLQERLIINISSNAADQNKSFAHPYAVIKGALDAASLQLSYSRDTRCRITNLRPGWTNTDSVRGFNVDGPKLEPIEVASMVAWLISGPSHIKIPSITMVAQAKEKEL